MYLFFDVETTGLPKNWRAKMTDLDNWPRVIQVAFILFNENRENIHEYKALIKPDGWQIPNEKFWIDNGYNQEHSLIHGIDIQEPLSIFEQDLQQCKYLIAHNMSFDHNVLGAEMIRANIKSENKPVKLCTKELSTKFCDLPGPYGPKWPKLEELYKVLFDKELQGAHDALNDVRACAECFFALVDKGIIELETKPEPTKIVVNKGDSTDLF